VNPGVGIKKDVEDSRPEILRQILQEEEIWNTNEEIESSILCSRIGGLVGYWKTALKTK
jgi:hypothetical protein